MIASLANFTSSYSAIWLQAESLSSSLTVSVLVEELIEEPMEEPDDDHRVHRVLMEEAPFLTTVTFAPGASTARLTLVVDPDYVFEPLVTTIMATLQPGAGYALLPSSTSASALVLDDDIPFLDEGTPPITIGFTESVFTRAEDSGEFQPEIVAFISECPHTRGPAAGAITFDLSLLVHDRTADSDDYDSAFISIIELRPENLVFKECMAGERGRRFYTPPIPAPGADLRIIDDEEAEQDETITLGLQTRGDTECLVRISQAAAFIEIEDNDEVSLSFLTPEGAPLETTMRVLGRQCLRA